MSIRGIIAPFVGPVSSATVAFPLAASVLALPLALRHYRRHGHVHPWRAVVEYSFVYYLIAATFLVLLPLPERPAGGLEGWNARFGALRRPQLDPRAFFLAILQAPSPQARARAIAQAAFNLLLLLPFGSYLVYLFRRKPIAAWVWGFLLSLLFETCQLTGIFWIYPGPYRLFDTGDLLLNSTGALAGAALSALLLRLRAIPDLDSLKGPDTPWIGPIRRGLALAVDCAAASVSSLAFLLLAEAAGMRPEWSPLLVALVFAAWLIALPALDGGRGLGKRLAFCAIRRRGGGKAGPGRLLARQAATWAPPLILVGLSGSARALPSIAGAVMVMAALAWLVFAAAALRRLCFGKEHESGLDRALDLRVRNDWKPPAAPKAGSARRRGAKAGGKRPALPRREPRR